MPVKYTLLTDGSSDRSLIRIIDWVLGRAKSGLASGFISQYADLRLLSERATKLDKRIRQTIDCFPCDMLFIHRDAENRPWSARITEIQEAAIAAAVQCHIAVVPVRMTEAWLLTNEQAIRKAADNPNGQIELDLQHWVVLRPSGSKKSLRDLIMAASEKRGRQRDKIKHDLSFRIHRVAELTDDFSPPGWTYPPSQHFIRKLWRFGTA